MNRVILLLVLLVTVSCGQEAPTTAKAVRNHRGEADFASFAATLRPKLTRLLAEYGITPNPEDGDKWFQFHVFRDKPEVIATGFVWAEVVIIANNRRHEFGVEMPLVFTLNFLRTGHNGPWYLLTDGGYVYAPYEDDERNQELPIELHVDLKRVFAPTMSFYDYLRRGSAE